MKNTAFSLFILLAFLSFNCSKNVTNPELNNSHSQNGKISLNIDKTSIPNGVVSVIATLSRNGYDNISSGFDILTDTTGQLYLNNIPVGTWHLAINAFNADSVILYTGETDVQINSGTTTQINLTLQPTGNGSGSIYINVNWGTSASQWTDYSANPVYNGIGNSSNTDLFSEPKIIYDNGIYKMWYLCTYSGGHGNIWYAESPDGINWQNKFQTPVLDSGPYGSWDDLAVYPGAVIKNGSTYMLYYNGDTTSYGRLSMGLATSTDGINWEKHSSPVLMGDSISEYHLATESVLIVNGKFYLYYGASPVNNYDAFSINLAISSDGINWQKYEGNPVLKPTAGWEGIGVTYPSVIFDNNQFIMVYENSGRSKFGIAVSADGINWIKKSGNPVFSNNNTANQYYEIDYPFLIKTQNEYRIYYTGKLIDNSLQICFARNVNIN